MAKNPDSVRHQLALLARRKRTRMVVWTRDRPIDWRAVQVRDPASGESFTEAGAWHFIADLLESGHPIDEVVLRKPPGKLAYAMIVDLAPGQPALYVKLQLGSGKVIGRSFHYTEVAPPQVRSEEDSTNEDPKNGE